MSLRLGFMARLAESCRGNTPTTPRQTEGDSAARRSGAAATGETFDDRSFFFLLSFTLRCQDGLGRPLQARPLTTERFFVLLSFALRCQDGLGRPLQA